MDKREEIIALIDNMNIEEQYYLFCEYCKDANYMDDMPEAIGTLATVTQATGIQATGIQATGINLLSILVAL